MSEVFQRNGESIIGQKSRKRRLLDGIDASELEQGKHLHSFLAEVQCSPESSVESSEDEDEDAEVTVWQTCNNLERFENARKVKWHDTELIEGVSVWKPIEAPAFEEPTFNPENIDLEELVIGERAETYKALSTFKAAYTQTIREQIEFYLGDDKLMKVAGSLDQVEWPHDLNKIKDSPELMEGFRLWPEIFKYNEMTPEVMNAEVDELIRILSNEESQIRWCDIWESDPTSFWSLLLTDGNLSPNMKRLVEATLAMPYGSAQAERMFSIMNLIKHKRRATLNPDTLDVLMRIKLTDETVKTLNVNRITMKYLLHHAKCDKGWSRLKKLEEYETLDDPLDPFEYEGDKASIISDILSESDSNSCSSNSDSSSSASSSSSEDDASSTSSEGDDSTLSVPGISPNQCSQWVAQCASLDHQYSTRNQLLERLPDELLFTFRNLDAGSKVLSVHNGRVVVKAYRRNDNSQKWFIRNKHIASYDGRVLQVTQENRPLRLANYDPLDTKQKWKIKRLRANKQVILSSFNNLRLDLIHKRSIDPVHRVGVKSVSGRQSQNWVGSVFTEEDE